MYVKGKIRKFIRCSHASQAKTVSFPNRRVMEVTFRDGSKGNYFANGYNQGILKANGVKKVPFYRGR